MENELPDALHLQITQLSELGNSQMKAKRYEEAIATFTKALDLVPEPKTDWEAGTWLRVALADACFLMKKWPEAGEHLRWAALSPGGVSNPFIHLRRGQVFLELGDEAKASQELTIALATEGEKIFGTDDPKYLRFVKTKLKPPSKGWWK